MRTSGAERAAHRFHAAQVLPRAGAADLQLHGAVPFLLHEPLAVGDDGFQRPVEPAAVGVVRLDFFRRGAAEQFPQRQFRRLRLQIPERDVDRAQRQVRDARAADPVNFRLPVEFLPERAHLARVFADEQRAEAVDDAIDDQPVGRQVRVRPGKPVADAAVVRVDRHAGRAPVGQLVRAVGDAAAGDGRVQDDGFEPGNFHVS